MILPDSAAPRVALIDDAGEHTFAQLGAAADHVAGELLATAGRGDLRDERVAFRIGAGFGYVTTLLGIWRAGGVAVPLCLSHPEPELAHVMDDTEASIVVAETDDEVLERLVARRGARLRLVADLVPAAGDQGRADVAAAATPARVLPEVPADRPALILYTSGTTGRPKGVVTSHAALRANVDTLIDAWGWCPEDRIVHVLPLHHTHGIVNALLCGLRSGATVDMLPGFDAPAVWERFAAGHATLFMAVPTVYNRLIGDWEGATPDERARRSSGARRMRLMVSGSAALPVPVFERWREITGQTLLERYGMTEIGMALSNPLDGERRPGSVGRPLPGVDIRLLDEHGSDVPGGSPGELHVRGPSLFTEYWNRPDETRAAFRDGWFRTGDIAILEDGAYRILGRESVDIIKTGGYKVSALEIENVLGGHPDIVECAVVGLEDPEWGEAVCAAIVARRALGRGELREWARERLAPYKLPSRVLCVPELPKNVMGKVTKPEVRTLFEVAAPSENPNAG